jgi:hypothetical protein
VSRLVALFASTGLLVTLTATPAVAQPNPPWVTAGMYYDEPPAPPAGSRFVGAQGSYAVATGQTVSKVEAENYKRDANNNLVYIGKVTDNAPANGNWKSNGSLSLAIRDSPGGALIRYTIIAKLYVQGSMAAVTSGLQADFVLSDPPL